VYTGILVGNMRGRENFKDITLDGGVIFRYISKKCAGMARTGLIWLRIGTGGDTYECDDKHLGSIKCG
jgi:hypothetical protein